MALEQCVIMKNLNGLAMLCYTLSIIVHYFNIFLFSKTLHVFFRFLCR